MCDIYIKENTFTFAFYWTIILDRFLCILAHTNFYTCLGNEKKSFKKFWRIALDSYRNQNIIFFPGVARIFSFRAHADISRDSTGLHRCRATPQAYRGGLRVLRGPCRSQSRNRGRVHPGLTGGRYCRLESTQGLVQT